MAKKRVPDVPTDADPAHCPWCSAVLRVAGLTTCPTCGASLTESEAADVPGLTKIDPEAILRARSPSQKSRGLMGWLSGEYRDKPAATEPKATFEPPDDEVRREMLRMEVATLEARVEVHRALLELERAESAGDAGEGPSAEAGDAVEPDEHSPGAADQA